MKKLTIQISDRTFAWLEVVAVGMAIEEGSTDEERQALITAAGDKSQNNFSNGVRSIIEALANNAAEDVRLNLGGAQSILGWQGRYLPTVFDPIVSYETATHGQRGFEFKFGSENDQNNAAEAYQAAIEEEQSLALSKLEKRLEIATEKATIERLQEIEAEAQLLREQLGYLAVKHEEASKN